MALARVAALRSEDPYRKVGAVALSYDNRVLGTAYNGLAPGFKAPDGFWEDRERRQKFMLHAEVNLMSLVERNDVKLVAVTTRPCTSCMLMLCAYGVKEIFYDDDYDSAAHEIADLYQIRLARLDPDESLIAYTPEATRLSVPESEIDQMKMQLGPFTLPRRQQPQGTLEVLTEADPKMIEIMSRPAKQFCRECGMPLQGGTCLECLISPAQ